MKILIKSTEYDFSNIDQLRKLLNNDINKYNLRVIALLDYYINFKVFRSNNNIRSRDTIAKKSNFFAQEFGIDNIIDFLLIISNDDEHNIVFKCIYDYFNGDFEISNEISEEIYYRQHISERLATSGSLRNIALEDSNGLCFLNCNNEKFIGRDGKIYLEVHHIIPISYAKQLDSVNLDVIGNLVALCPTCHRRVHLENVNSEFYMINHKKLYEKIVKSELQVYAQDFESYLKILINT